MLDLFQFGFRSRYGTETTLADDLRNTLDGKTAPLLISQPLNTSNRGILLEICQTWEWRGSVLRWLRSCCWDRSHKAMLKDWQAHLGLGHFSGVGALSHITYSIIYMKSLGEVGRFELQDAAHIQALSCSPIITIATIIDFYTVISVYDGVQSYAPKNR